MRVEPLQVTHRGQRRDGLRRDDGQHEAQVGDRPREIRGEGVPARFVRGLAHDVGVVLAAALPVDGGLVDDHVPVVQWDRAFGPQDVHDHPQVGVGRHGRGHDGHTGRVPRERHLQGHDLASVEAGQQLDDHEDRLRLDVGRESFVEVPRDRELVLVEPHAQGLDAVGVENRAVVGTDVLAGDDRHPPGRDPRVHCGGRTPAALLGTRKVEVTALLVLVVQEELRAERDVEALEEGLARERGLHAAGHGQDPAEVEGRALIVDPHMHHRLVAVHREEDALSRLIHGRLRVAEEAPAREGRSGESESDDEQSQRG